MSRHLALIVVLACGFAAESAGQSILTVAGGGPIGDGKIATQGVLRVPSDVAVDPGGNLFIVDSQNQRIRRVDAATQIITTFAGGGTSGAGEGGPATAAEMFPTAIAIYGGDVYISEGGMVRKVPLGGGNIITVAGGGDIDGEGIPATRARLNGTNGIALDSAGNLYIAIPNEHRVRRVDAQTRLITTVAGTGTPGLSGDGGPGPSAQLDFPFDVTVDPAGNLLIGEWGLVTRPETRNPGRVRRVDRQTGIITTIAGGGEARLFDEPLPALSIAFGYVSGVAVDRAGNLFISSGNILRVDTAGNATNYAGGGPEDFAGDGGPARGASLNFAGGIALDEAGNLFIADSRNLRVRRVDAATAIISTVAGSGAPADDGLPATAAALFAPMGVALDRSGNLFVPEHFNYRVRRVDAVSRVITTVAGTGRSGHTGDGGPATAARMREPWGIAFDSGGNLHVTTRVGQVRRIDARTGIITTVVGDDPEQGYGAGFSGDGGPANRALINHATGITFDASDNLFIADTWNHRVRRVDARTGIITTIAGSGPILPDQGGFSGDGGPATSARLSYPAGVAVDAGGNVYVADEVNDRIRRIDAATGIITTFAGSGRCCDRPRGDGGPATEAQLFGPTAVAFDGSGNLHIAERHTVRRVDARTGIITTVIGDNNRGGFTGDGGPALSAGFSNLRGLAIDPQGNIFVADTNNNRIRAVFACRSLTPPVLTAPADGANVGTAPTLGWNAVDGAFRYDVFLTPDGSPLQLVASNITGNSFTPANLLPGTRYTWLVVAKGDPFCLPLTPTAQSPVRSFTTTAGCQAPGAFDLNTPADGAPGQPASLSLTWSAASAAASYDVLLGTTNPPPLAATVSTTTFTANGLAPGTTYFWGVVARSACDSARTTTTPIRSFQTAGACPTPGAFTQITPNDGAQNISTTATLEWSPSSNASTYDLYLGTTNPPPIYLLDLTTTKLAVSGFGIGQTYFWRVAAKVGCDATRSASTPVARFAIRGNCAVPRQTSISFAPPSSVGVGQTYVVAWQDAQELEPGGYYVIERSLDESFTTIVDTQETSANSASFVAADPGMYFHRVRPINRCGTGGAGGASSARAVNVVSAAPNVIFTVQPEAVLTTLGEKLEDKRTRFVLENIGTDTVSVIVGRQEIDSQPFFTIIDPFGGDATFLTLPPRTPRTLEIRFSGPPNDQPASYQGVVFLAALGKGLAITPYGFVNLRVGGGDAATPEFRNGGLGTEYAFFPGFSGNDTNRPPITVDIRNPGSTPMELGAEIGPEVWLVPESGWNATPIPPGATRSVRLFTRRARAPNGSALPRYTYLTVRTKAGRTARILIQDNDIPPTAAGRGAALDPSIRSLIVPDVASATLADGNRLFSTVRLSNLGSDAVTADLFFTPAQADGFDTARVRRATIAVPPNDVVTLTDPSVQLWGLPQPAKGQIEVRSAPEKIGLLAVSAAVSQTSAGGGAFSYTVPVLSRGEGARISISHTISGISATGNTIASLTLAETSGADRVSVRVTLTSNDDVRLGETTIEVPRYSAVEVGDLTALGGVAELQAARLDLTILAGGGSVIGLVKLLDRTRGGGATLISRNAEATQTTNGFRTDRSMLQSLWQRLRGSGQTAPARTFLLPAVFSGSAGGAQLQTTLGLYAPRETTTFNLTYREGATTRTASVTVPPRRIVEYANALQQLFETSSGEGSLLIETSASADVYARLTSANTGVSRVTVTQALPVLAGDSEFVTTPTSQRPLYLDGLEQSIDPSRGSNWSLVLNEISGRSATVVIRLYEAGNRSAPIAQKEFPLAALQRLKLPSVFGALDLDSINRRKDRTNMLVSVVYKSGAGAATAIAMATDNRTGDSKSYVLGPASASSPFSVQRATAIAPTSTDRRRAVRH